MIKARLLSIILIATIAMCLLPIKVNSTDPIIAHDYRGSQNGFFIQETFVYRVPENLSDEDLYATKVSLFSTSILTVFCSVSFSIDTTGIAHDISPYTGFQGGGFSISCGGGLSVSGSVPISACIASGILSNNVKILVGSLIPFGRCDSVVLWSVPEGEPFDFIVRSTVGLWLLNPFLPPMSDGAEWQPSAFVLSPLSTIMTSFTHTSTTVAFGTFNFPAFDGDTIISTDMWEWDFGDGSTFVTVDNQVNHTYAHPGMYNVKLTAYAYARGWFSPKYVDHFTTSATIEIVPDTVNVDALAIIENYDDSPPYELQSRYISGIGQNNSYNGHVKGYSSKVWLMASVTSNEQPVEGVLVNLTLMDQYGERAWFSRETTNASGIASEFLDVTEMTEAGIYTLIAEVYGKKDTVSFSHIVCLLITGYTYDGYTAYIEDIYLVPESYIVEISATVPSGYQFSRWIVNFFWEAYDNPLYLLMEFDYLIIAEFQRESTSSTNGGGRIPLIC